MSRPLARRDAVERHDAAAARGGGGDDGCARRRRRGRLRDDRPARRPLAAVHAPQKNLAGLTPHAEVVSAGEIVVEEIPHVKPPCNIPLGGRPIANAVPSCPTSTKKSADGRKT